METKPRTRPARRRRPAKKRRNDKRLVKAAVAGGVVAARIDGKLKFLMIQHALNHQWSLPKGHVEEGETTMVAAVREIKEETGVAVRPLEFLGHTNIWTTHDDYHLLRRFHAYLLEPVGDTTIHTHKLDPEEGMIGDARWMSPEEAIRRVPYKNILPLLKQARDRLKELNRG